MVYEWYLKLEKEDSQKYFYESISITCGLAYIKRKDYARGIQDLETRMLIQEDSEAESDSW